MQEPSIVNLISISDICLSYQLYNNITPNKRHSRWFGKLPNSLGVEQSPQFLPRVVIAIKYEEKYHICINIDY
jgi:hypothetical protein